MDTGLTLALLGECHLSHITSESSEFLPMGVSHSLTSDKAPIFLSSGEAKITKVCGSYLAKKCQMVTVNPHLPYQLFQAPHFGREAEAGSITHSTYRRHLWDFF
jgi:hypothetical protein